MASRNSHKFVFLLVICLVGGVALAPGVLGNAAFGLAAPPSGGNLVSSLRQEPKTFNRFVDRSYPNELFSLLTTSRLARINRVTMALEPMLAESWTRSADNLTYTLKLRRGVRFSDGAPFTSADVVFSFHLADCVVARCAPDDKENGSVLRETLRVAGKPLVVAAIDETTVAIRFPSPFGPGLRLLDNLPIYPKHLLEQSLNDGTFGKAWGTTTAPAKMAGLGPFVLREYVAGQRLVFDRNPNYWRKDAGGARLPYLDHLTLEIVTDTNAEALRVESGQIDCMSSEIRLEDYTAMKQAAAVGKLKLHDLGVGLETAALWFNLRKDAKAAPAKKAWLQSVELRRAIAESVDRKRFADMVFLGAGTPVYGPVSPANKLWFDPQAPKPAFDVKSAAARLKKLGFAKKGADGILLDATGQALRFTVLTRQGNSVLERGAAFLRDALAAVGIGLDVVAVDPGTLGGRIEKGDYEAVYYSFFATDLDPAMSPDLWLSSGSAHVWNPSQPTPATDWERRVDDLMTQQAASLDETKRRALFNEVQRIMADQLPLLYFAAPRVILATSTRLLNVTPSLIRPMVTWSADTLAVTPGKGTN